jgi:GH18 family chitinase
VQNSLSSACDSGECQSSMSREPVVPTRRLALLLGSLFLALACHQQAATDDTGSPPSEVGNHPVWVSAYYAGWYWDWASLNPATSVASVDMTTMTHFIFGRYAPGAGTQGGSAGQLMPGAGTGHTQVEDALIAKAHASGVRALAMLGGAGDGSGWAASTASAARATFIKNILDQCVAKNYDGVDVDWEENLDASANQSLLIAFLTELRSAAALRSRYQSPNAPFIITFPGSYVNVNTGLPIEAWKVTVASRVDQYNLMTYAMTYCCSGWDTWLWAALKGAEATHPTSVESSIKAYVDAGVPRGKMGMGLGLYGGGYTPPVTGPRQAVGGTWGGDDNVNTWRDFYGQGMFSGGAYTFDTAAQTGYYTYSPAKSYRGTNVSMLISEDPQSIAAKGAWAKAGNCGGTIVWTINYGYVDETVGNPPMQAIKRSFLGS